jgi:hypothetical protein
MAAETGYTDRSTSVRGGTPYNDRDTCPTVIPEIQDLYNQIAIALEHARDEASMLDERLGYVSTSAAPECADKDGLVPERSPLAHNLYCILCDINRLSYKLSGMRGRLQI